MPSLKERIKQKEEEKKNSSSSTNMETSASLMDRIKTKEQSVMARREKEQFEREIDFTTFESDLQSMGSTISGIYNGWQTADTMSKTKISVEAMQKRINKYQAYQKKYGGADLSEVASGYQSLLDQWDDLSSWYGNYKNADAFDAAKKKAQFDLDFAGLTYDQVQAKKKEFAEDSDEYKYLSEYMNYSNLTDFDKALENTADYDYYKKLKKAKNQYELDHASDRYAHLEKNEDFDKHSQYVSTINGDAKWWQKKIGDATYEYINNYDGKIRGDLNDKHRKYSSDSAITTLSSYEERNLDQLNEQEIKYYNYLYATEGKDSANKFLEDMEVTLGKRATDKQSADIKEAVDGSVLASIGLSAISPILNIGGGLYSGVANLGSVLKGEESNPYGGYQRVSGMASDIRKYVGENIEESTDFDIFGQNIPRFLYDTGMSVADSSVGALSLGRAYTPLMGMNAYQQKAKELTEAGEDADTIHRLASANGLAEAVFEYVSIDKLLKIKDVDSLGKFIAQTAKQMGVEASEEIFTETSNILMDEIIRGAGSDLRQMKQDLLSRGYSEKEADKEVTKQALSQIGWAGIGGALSGGVMGGVASAGNWSQNASKDKQVSLKEDVSKRAKSLAQGEVTGVTATGNSAKIQGIKKDGDKTTLVTSEGELSVDDMTFTSDDAELVAIAETMSEEKANLLLSQYDGQSNVNEYVDSFELAYEYGEKGFGAESALEKKGVLSVSQVGAIYNGAIKNQAISKQRAIDELNEKHASKTVIAGKFDDSVIDRTNSGKGEVNWKDLTSKQRSAVNFAKAFSKVTGVNVAFSTKGAEQGFNGFYDSNSNTITIDVYAGIDRLSTDKKTWTDSIVSTLSHEMTHWMKEKSPAMYNKMREHIMGTMEMDGKVWSNLVNSRMEKTEENHPELKGKISEEYAEDEIIARACEDMLSNSKTARKLLETMSESEQKTFISEVKKIYNRLIDWVNDLLTQYKSNSTEAKILRDYKERMEELSKMWDKALAEAVQTNQNLQKEGKTGEKVTQYSDRGLHSIDSEYMAVVEQGDMKTAQKMVDHAAKKAGYNSPKLYHGTKSFGFTEFKLDKMDDKKSIFLTSEMPIASTYSGVMSERKISDSTLNQIQDMTPQDVIKELNSDKYKTGEDATQKQKYSYYELKDINSLIGNVNQSLEELRYEIPNMIKEYADRMAKDFDETTYKAHKQLVNLDKSLTAYDYAGIPTKLYMLLHHTDVFKDSGARIAVIEKNMRLLEKLRNRDNSNGAIVEDWLDGYSIEVLSIEEAKNLLELKDKSGNYSLYAKMSHPLEINCQGSIWNDIRHWTESIEPTTSNTVVERKGEKYHLVDKKNGKLLEDGALAVNSYTEKMQLNERHAFMVDKAKQMIRIRNEELHTTRQISDFALKQGYDGVVFKNLRDNGGQNVAVDLDETADIYVVFNPENVKSADAVTYDEDGDVIPLSERFDSNKADIRYSDRDTLDEQIEKTIKGELPRRQALYFGHTSEILQKVGLSNLPVLYTQSHLRDALAPKNEKKHQHGLTKAQILGVPQGLEKPVMVFDSWSKNDSIIVVTEMLDNDNCPIIAVIRPNGQGMLETEIVPSNFMTSVYGRSGFKNFVDIAISTNNVLYVNKTKSQKLFQQVRVQFPQGLSTLGFDKIIHQSNNIVKPNHTQNSDRETTSVYDVMGENEYLKKENRKLSEDIERLRECLKLEKTITNGNTFNRNQLQAVAGYLRNIANSNYDKNTLVGELDEVYSYIMQTPNLIWDNLMTKCYEVAENLLREQRGTKVTDNYFKDVLTEIRTTRISLSEEQIQEAKNAYGDKYRNAFMGRIMITKDGISLDQQWQEWSSKYPEIFDADTTCGGQITALSDIYDYLREGAESYQMFNDVESTRALAVEIYNQYWNVSTIRTTADKYNKQIKRLNFEHRKTMGELRTDYKKKVENQKVADAIHYGKIINNIRQRKEAEVQQAREFGRRRVNEYRDRAERNAKIKSITNKALVLNKWLTKNSKDEHIHEALKGPVINLLQAIDFSSKQLLGMSGGNKSGTETQKDISLSKALSQVKDMMADANVGKEELISLYGIDMGDEIKELVDSVDDILRNVGDNEYVLNQMSLEDLKTLDKMVGTIKHAVTRMNKFHTVNHAQGIVSLSQSTIIEVDSLGKAKIHDGMRGWTDKLLKWGNVLPYYAFKRFGEGGRKVYEAFQDGWDTFAFHVKEIIDYTNNAYTSKEVKEWGKDIKTFDVIVPVKDSDMENPDYAPEYQRVQMTVPQIMSLYCLQKREQAKGHMMGGGIRVANIKTKNGIVSQSDGVILGQDDIIKIVGLLTDRQIAVADALQEFMNTTCTDWGNEVSMLRFGYKAFGEENYFPIQSDKNNLAVNDETEQNNSLFRLLNMSFTKTTTEQANNRIVISDIFDVFAQHTSDMAKYNALALPVLDAFRWYNYKEKGQKGETQFITKSVKQSLEKAFGKDAQNYITTFLRDINGSENTSRDTVGKHFFSNAKIASVAANLRVAFLQPTSYLRASAVIDTKYLSKALLHTPKIGRAEKYCGIAQWKALGFYDTNIQRGVTSLIKHDETWKDKAIEKSMKGAEWGDKITWGYLWNACELEVRETQKNLKVGSDEFYTAIGKRLREVIYATQVVDSTMTRSQMMRSSDMYDKMLTSFASEPTLSYNMLQDAYMEWSLDARRTSKKEAYRKNRKKIFRVATAYTITNIVCAMVESGFDAYRDDEEEEMTLETFMKMYISNFMMDMSITGKIPYIKEFTSILQGFSSSRTDTQWMQSFGYALKGITKIIKEGEGNAYSAFKNLLKGFSYVSGLPFYNAWRDSVSLLDKTDILTSEELEKMFNSMIE